MPQLSAITVCIHTHTHITRTSCAGSDTVQDNSTTVANAVAVQHGMMNSEHARDWVGGRREQMVAGEGGSGAQLMADTPDVRWAEARWPCAVCKHTCRAPLLLIPVCSSLILPLLLVLLLVPFLLLSFFFPTILHLLLLLFPFSNFTSFACLCYC